MGDKKQTDSKILRNVFAKGDAYWNSGDLFTVDQDYFVYFADRTGDTFRSVFEKPFSFILFFNSPHFMCNDCTPTASGDILFGELDSRDIFLV